MNLKGVFLVAMVAFGLNACSDSDGINGDENSNEGRPTYITLSVSLPSMGNRALRQLRK